MTVSLDAQVGIYSELLGPILEMLAEAVGGAEVTGDDVLDLFALGMASVIDNDNLIDASNMGDALKTAAARVERHVNRLRELRAKTGKSLLSVVLEHGPIEEPTVN